MNRQKASSPLELSVGVPLDARLSMRSKAACFLPLLRRMLLRRLKIIAANPCASGLGDWDQLPSAFARRCGRVHPALLTSPLTKLLTSQSFCTPTDCKLPAVSTSCEQCDAAPDKIYVNIELVGQKAVRVQKSREGLLASRRLQYRRASRVHYRCTKRTIA